MTAKLFSKTFSDIDNNNADHVVLTFFNYNNFDVFLLSNKTF